jgi:hypothetical protein
MAVNFSSPGSGLCNAVAYGTTLGSYNAGLTGLPSNASANQKGAWTQLTSGTSYDSNFAVIMLGANSNTNPQETLLIDVGIGASGSEIPILNNLPLWVYGQYGGTFYSVAIPLSIPAGTRISARAQSSISGSSSDACAGLILYDGAFSSEYGSAGLDTLGVTTSGATALTSVTPGNGAMGSWTQISSSTPNDYRGLFLYTAGSATLLADVAIGSSEQAIIISRFRIYPTTGLAGGCSPYLPLNLPAGSALWVRYSDNAAGGSSVYAAICGVYK